jgi:hypothetical protein
MQKKKCVEALKRVTQMPVNLSNAEKTGMDEKTLSAIINWCDFLIEFTKFTYGRFPHVLRPPVGPQ